MSSVLTSALAADGASECEALPPSSEVCQQSTGAQIIVRTLERRGIQIVAGIPGGALLPVYEALSRCSRIRHILARHEQAAGFIAQGIARVTGKAGVCLATSGPGVTNMITALADAKMDSVPLVCITGQVPSSLIGTDAFQEVATVELARPVTKAAFMARSASELAELLGEAFHIAESGRPGPVLIDVPKDVQMERCADIATTTLRTASRLPRHRALLDRAAAMIDAAERPLLYVGGGVVKANAQRAVEQLAERASIPVGATLMAMGAMPHDHPLNLGMLGMHGALATHHAVEECDLLIAIGARFDDRVTGDAKRFACNAKIVHIDIDPREFGKIKTPALAIHADAWSAVTGLAARVTRTDRSVWLARIAELRARFAARASNDGNAETPVDFIREIGRVAPRDAILATDVGQHQMWAAQAYPFTRANRWLTSGGLGTMGFGLPAAIGAALAEPEATVVCITGDGSLLMNIQELATLAELDLNVKVVLLDNGGFGLVRQQQQLFYARRYCASQFAGPCDFVRIAQAFGVVARDLQSSSDWQTELRATLSARGPMLIRARIDADHLVLPMVAPGGANTDALQW
jgi:acetolactate synthase I/II/III large subunit